MIYLNKLLAWRFIHSDACLGCVERDTFAIGQDANRPTGECICLVLVLNIYITFFICVHKKCCTFPVLALVDVGLV